MLFTPYLSAADGAAVPVHIRRMRASDAQQTIGSPEWQSDWTSDYIRTSDCDKYAVLTASQELVAQ